MDLQGAVRAVIVTFAAIGSSLDSLGPLALVDVTALLPPRFARLVRDGASRGGPAGFVVAVTERERTTPGFAKEHARVVCETFAGMLDARRLQGLRERLPAEVAALLMPHEPRPQLAWTARQIEYGDVFGKHESRNR